MYVVQFHVKNVLPKKIRNVLRDNQIVFIAMMREMDV